MISIEELKTYTQEELLLLSDMINEILSKKTNLVDEFFSNLDTSTLDNITVQSIYEKYLDWCNNSKVPCIDKKIFYKVCHDYITKYNIKLTVRKKEKPEKEKKPGIETSTENK
jgi:hypothetical protein